MKTIAKIAYQYPELDMTGLLILLQVDALPGQSIREIADILGLNPKFAQQKIAQLCAGRKKHYRRSPKPGRRSRKPVAYGLINYEYNLGDGRKRSLAVTEMGGELIGELENWRVGELGKGKGVFDTETQRHREEDRDWKIVIETEVEL